MCLTPQGHAIRPELERILRETTDALLRGLDTTDRETLSRLLRQVAANINEADQ